MNSFREKLLLLWNRIKRSYADYRVTVSAVALLSIFEAIHNFLYVFDYDVREQMLLWKCFYHAPEVNLFLALFLCAAMLTESCLPYTYREMKARVIRILCFLAGALIAGIAVVGISVEELTQFHESARMISRWAEQFSVGYALLLILGTVYFCHRKSGAGFIEYMLHVLVNWCVTTAVFFVLSIGVALVLSVVDTLFFESYGMLGDTGIILVMGLYYVPGCIMALQNTDSNIETPLGKLLLRYILPGMTICALLIVYVYLLKNLIMWEMPSNELFRIITGLFCFGMPIWVMNYYYQDGTRYMRILQKLPYALLPLIPIQTYAMCVRIYEHGMTQSRYMGMVMVAFEIATLLIWYFWKEKMERILIFSAVCVLIVFLLPGINVNSLSDRWQRTFLESYYHKLLTQGSLTQMERQRLRGAYRYLRDIPGMASVVEQCNIYEESFAAKLEETGVDMVGYTQTESHRIQCWQMVDSLYVDDYSRLYMLNEDAGYHASGDEKLSVDFSAFRFRKGENGAEEIIIADLSAFVEQCMAYIEEHPDAYMEDVSAAMKPYNQITLNDGSVLYLTDFFVRYEDGIKDGEAYFAIESVDVAGMLLEKTKNSLGMTLTED